MSENNGAGVLTGAELMARARREIELPAGGKIVIGRVQAGDLAQILGTIPDIASLASMQKGDARDLVKRPEAKAILGMLCGVIQVGVIAPKLFEQPQDGPTARDFTLDEQFLLFTQILDLSGYSKAAGGKVLPLSGTAA